MRSAGSPQFARQASLASQQLSFLLASRLKFRLLCCVCLGAHSKGHQRTELTGVFVRNC